MEKRKCKMQMKERNDKIVMTMQGYCNPQKPKEKVNVEYEMDMDI